MNTLRFSKFPVFQNPQFCSFQLFITIMDKLRLQIRAMDEVSQGSTIATSHKCDQRSSSCD